MTGEGSPPQPSPEDGKFDSLRSHALYLMVSEGWANDSAGTIEAPTGYFARLSYTPADLYEVVSAFAEDFEEIGFRDTGTLIGNFMLREDHFGLVTVTEFEDELVARRAFERMHDAFEHWKGEQA